MSIVSELAEALQIAEAADQAYKYGEQIRGLVLLGVEFHDAADLVYDAYDVFLRQFEGNAKAWSVIHESFAQGYFGKAL